MSKKKILLAFFLLLFLLYWYALPKPLFDAPYSYIIEDTQGRLLAARIATDGQWRFPQSKKVPARVASALTSFEDKRFYRHWGVDVRALLRAFRQNVKAGKVVSGGSTLNMQIIRLSRKKRKRNLYQKIIEIILATRLEWRYSKEEILALYSAHAPFGGNVVGLEAAAWRYYGKAPEYLSWGEACTLAVLPNSPALIHPGRNRAALLAKRNRLLDKLLALGKISAQQAALAKEERIPERPLPLPQLVPHLLDRFIAEQSKVAKPNNRLRSTIDRSLQIQCTDIARQHHRQLSGNGIHNLAILVLDIERGAVRAYVGNAPDAGAAHGQAVDVIPAARSTGSILKPFLYAQMLHHGNISPNSLISDVPTRISGYRPENFHRSFQGVVSAKQALIRSLNVPFVHMLQDYGLEKFHFGLKKLGITSIHKPPDHYGLTLILGGAEASLWEISNSYASMARSLAHFYDYDGRYDPLDYRPAHYQADIAIPLTEKSKLKVHPPVLSAAAIWQTFDAMQEVQRPTSEGNWEVFEAHKRIAWKTGTSFGFRDAWAVGIDGRYVVGIWAGNADGEGRPGLVGVRVAGPILFDVMALLDGGDWWEPPYDEMVKIPLCKRSGYRTTSICEADSQWVAKSALRVKPCPYHRLLHLDPSERYQVRDDCMSVDQMVHKPWFVLPPLEEFYYRSVAPDYRQAPPLHDDCIGEYQNTLGQSMQFIYPKSFLDIYIPVDLDGSKSKVIFKVAHRQNETTIYWHLDNVYLGKTKDFHEMALLPSPGKHVLTLVDEAGERLVRGFEVVE